MTDYFQQLNDYVYRMQQESGATAAAVVILRKDDVLHEWYSGRHDASPDSRLVDARTQFNVASIRKTYLGFAVSLLIEQGSIGSVEDEIGRYLQECGDWAQGVTLRHLLTHTHGLMERDGCTVKEFPAGQDWAYRNTGIHLLIKLVEYVAGETLSGFIRRHVLIPYQLQETGWRTAEQEELIYNYYRYDETWVGPNDSGAGDQSNLFVSARELAVWGNIHLRRGCRKGEQLIPASVFERITTCLTPAELPANKPRHGFIWWLQNESQHNQIGERLPDGSYQVMGITGCTCLVIPVYEAVVIRMYNQLRNPGGYDYLADLRTFGNIANDLLRNGDTVHI